MSQWKKIPSNLFTITVHFESLQFWFSILTCFEMTFFFFYSPVPRAKKNHISEALKSDISRIVKIRFTFFNISKKLINFIFWVTQKYVSHFLLLKKLNVHLLRHFGLKYGKKCFASICKKVFFFKCSRIRHILIKGKNVI